MTKQVTLRDGRGDLAAMLSFRVIVAFYHDVTRLERFAIEKVFALTNLLIIYKRVLKKI